MKETINIFEILGEKKEPQLDVSKILNNKADDGQMDVAKILSNKAKQNQEQQNAPDFDLYQSKKAKAAGVPVKQQTITSAPVPKPAPKQVIPKAEPVPKPVPQPVQPKVKPVPKPAPEPKPVPLPVQPKPAPKIKPVPLPVQPKPAPEPKPVPLPAQPKPAPKTKPAPLPAPPKPAPEPKPAPKRRFSLVRLIVKLVTFGIIGAVLFTFVIGLPRISMNSMDPMISDGDMVIVSKLAKEFSRNDIVVFKDDNGKKMTARVVAVKGDMVSINNKGELYVNNKLQVEDNIHTATTITDTAISYPVIVNEDTYFVLGDNRIDSMDSRNSSIGLLETDRIVGKVIYCFKKIN